MIYYRSHNYFYFIQGSVAAIFIGVLVWFSQNNDVQTKVVFTIVISVALVLFFVASRLPSIVIDDVGIKVGGSYTGPFKSFSEYTPYKWQWTKNALILEWGQIRSLRIGVWKPWFSDLSNIFTSTHFFYRDSYLIIENEHAAFFVVTIVGSPLSWAWRSEAAVVSAVTQSGWGHLMSSEIAKF